MSTPLENCYHHDENNSPGDARSQVNGARIGSGRRSAAPAGAPSTLALVPGPGLEPTADALQVSLIRSAGYCADVTGGGDNPPTGGLTPRGAAAGMLQDASGHVVANATDVRLPPPPFSPY